MLLQAVGHAAGDPGALQGRRVPDGRARALVVARLALLEDVFQVQLEDGSEELEEVRGVVVLVDDGLAELRACRETGLVAALGDLLAPPTVRQSPRHPLHASGPAPPAMSAPVRSPLPPLPHQTPITFSLDVPTAIFWKRSLDTGAQELTGEALTAPPRYPQVFYSPIL